MPPNKRAALHRKAGNLTIRTNRYGGTDVFLSRRLFNPLGSYDNLAGGAAGLD